MQSGHANGTGSAPKTSADEAEPKDATLGGYLEVHSRPPAFEVEKTANLRSPWAAYLVFPKWAETGLGVVGHVETPLLWEGKDEQEAVRAARDTPLARVKELLDQAIRKRDEDLA
jgi:hypothetical protein